jgi:hypothetical protein
MPRRITIQTTAGEVLFRLPNERDAWELHGTLPLLRASFEGETAGPANEEKRLAAGVKAIDLANELLIKCALKPRIVPDGTPVQDVSIAVSVEELTCLERVSIMTQLLALVGFSKEEADRIDPFAGRTETSGSSMPSGNGTDSARAAS